MSKRKPDEKSQIRNMERLHTHRYGVNRRGNGRGYTLDELKLFLSMNNKNDSGRYENTDIKIAQDMQISLATVQYLRRKCNIIRKLNVPSEKMIDFFKMSEKALSDLLKAQS